MDLEMMNEAASVYIETVIPIIRESFRAGFKAGVQHAEAVADEICQSCMAEAEADIKKEAEEDQAEAAKQKDHREFLAACRRVVRGVLS